MSLERKGIANYIIIINYTVKSSKVCEAIGDNFIFLG